jgi:quinol-cytochrome oxidoreductase complex cytochrome b subunit
MNLAAKSDMSTYSHTLMYVTVELRRHDHRRIRRLVNGIGSLWGTAVAIAAAAGIPLAWIWMASKLAGTKPDLTPSLAVFIATGILVSYWLALLVGSWIRGRTVDTGEERARVTRRSWNRSFRDAPRPDDQRIDPIERVFIVVGVLAIIAFEIWFFFFAGDPLPSQPAF